MRVSCERPFIRSGIGEGMPDATICGKGDEVALDHCKVLADPSRCRLVAAIIEAGELCVCDLAATVEMSESNVSHHLGVLRAHGLVRARREGKMVFYSPDDAHIRVLLSLIPI